VDTSRGHSVAVGCGHRTPVTHRGHGRSQRQLELGEVGAPVPERSGGHARVIGTGRVPVILARHAGRPTDVHQRCLLVVVTGRGGAGGGRGGNGRGNSCATVGCRGLRGGGRGDGRVGGTFCDLAGHAFGR